MEKNFFKSNIKCTGCLKNVASHLSTVKGIVSWDIALENPDRILAVEGKGITAEQISSLVSKAGFEVEQIK